MAERDGRVAGFLTWRRWYQGSAEITWMAVHASERRRGTGGALVEALTSQLAGRVRFLVVTTLS